MDGYKKPTLIYVKANLVTVRMTEIDALFSRALGRFLIAKVIHLPALSRLKVSFLRAFLMSYEL